MRIRSLATVVGATAFLASANTAFAQTPSDVDALPVTAETTVLTLFGTGINLSVGVDEEGNLTTVQLTDGTDDVAASEISAHNVTFLIGENSTEIEVEVDDTKVTTEVQASTLAALVGTHTWSGELFAGSEVTTITFSISISTVDGSPVVDSILVQGPGSESAVVTVEVSDEGDEAEAKIRIEFVGTQARITVEVEAEQEDDGEVEAELKVTVRSAVFAPEESEDVDDDGDDLDDDADDDDDLDDDADDDDDFDDVEEAEASGDDVEESDDDDTDVESAGDDESDDDDSDVESDSDESDYDDSDVESDSDDD